MAEDLPDEAGDGGEMGGFVALDGPHDGLGARLGHEHQGAAELDPLVHRDGHPVAVEEGDGADDDGPASRLGLRAVAPAPEPVVGLEGVGHQVVVGEHHALGRAGGPRGVEDDRQVLLGGYLGQGLHGWALDESLEAQRSLRDCPSQPLQPVQKPQVPRDIRCGLRDDDCS